MEQNQNNEIDLRKIARVVLEHWWWFLVSVAALSLIGTLYYLRTPFRWTTDGSIVLRTQDMHIYRLRTVVAFQEVVPRGFSRVVLFHLILLPASTW